jgi:sulfate adenylyltransferase
MDPFNELVYLPLEGRYVEADKVPESAEALSLSGTRVRSEYLNCGKRFPERFTRPEVAAILAKAYPPRHQKGFCIRFTGLSGNARLIIDYLFNKGFLRQEHVSSDVK